MSVPFWRAYATAAVLALTIAVGAQAASASPAPPVPDPSIVGGVLNPSQELVAAAEQVTALTDQAKVAAQAYLDAQIAREDALARASAARETFAAAQAQADAARAALGVYAASAYINGGASANLAATLSAGTPTEALARQNTLDAVAGTSTDLVRVLKQAQAQADAALAEAEAQQQRADAAAETARSAAAQADQAAKDAQALMSTLAASELAAQQTPMLLARAGAYWSSEGSAVNAKGIPFELVAYGNGQIPAEALSPIAGFDGHRLWAPAARSFERLVAAAAAEGVTIGVSDSYRPYAVQVATAAAKGLYSQGGLAAQPGTSDHGWGLALDLVLDATAQDWMRNHAAAFGFVEDVPREAWHWAFYATGAP